MEFRNSAAIKNTTALLLRDLIHERTGILFGENNMDLMVDKINSITVEGGDSLIDYYYGCFNALRFTDAAALFSEGHIEFSPGAPWSGPDGYLHFAEAWASAFPPRGIDSTHYRRQR